MTSNEPHLKTSFTYKGAVIRVNWYELVGSELPDLPWQQVYVIGDIDGKVPVVHYATGDKDNLPGGKTEPGELVDETVRRETQEELNCDVVSWYPLGYQENHEPDGKVVYQLRVRAELKPIGVFENDPGGAISGHTLVSLDELNEHIQYGDIGERMIALVKDAEKNESSVQPSTKE